MTPPCTRAIGGPILTGRGIQQCPLAKVVIYAQLHDLRLFTACVALQHACSAIRDHVKLFTVIALLEDVDACAEDLVLHRPHQ
eukprot:6207154-Prymnesium_polylepis.2